MLLKTATAEKETGREVGPQNGFGPSRRRSLTAYLRDWVAFSM